MSDTGLILTDPKPHKYQEDECGVETQSSWAQRKGRAKFLARQRLQCLIYLLVRDEISFGALEKLMMNVDKIEEKDVIFSEKLQAEYAEKIVDRLVGEEL